MFLDASVFGLFIGLFFLVVYNSCSNSCMVFFRLWWWWWALVVLLREKKKKNDVNNTDLCFWFWVGTFSSCNVIRLPMKLLCGFFSPGRPSFQFLCRLSPQKIYAILKITAKSWVADGQAADRQQELRQKSLVGDIFLGFLQTEIVFVLYCKTLKDYKSLLLNSVLGKLTEAFGCWGKDFEFVKCLNSIWLGNLNEVANMEKNFLGSVHCFCFLQLPSVWSWHPDM